jgi:HemY protein
MRALIGAILFAAVVIAGSWFVARLPGQVTAEVGTLVVQVSTATACLLLLAVIAGAWLLGRLTTAVRHWPERLRRQFALRRRLQGEAAVTHTLLALAAGKPSEARREAARLRELLGDTPQTLLLFAEAARLAGDTYEARNAFAALATREDAAFLGLRGLLRQAIESADWPAAAELASEAERASPGAGWLRAERARLAVRAGAWRDALALADSASSRAALAIAAADAEVDWARSLLLAKQAFDADPALAPAAIAYAIRLRQRGQEGRVQTVLGRAWDARPHPDLAACALESTADRLARVHLARRLVDGMPEHAETHLLLARVSIDAGLTGEGRRHLEAARLAGVNQRRAWLLLAEIEERERGETEAGRLAQREALKHAATADPDPVWRCAACGSMSPNWKPVCAACGEVGRINWRDERRLALAGA